MVVSRYSVLFLTFLIIYDIIIELTQTRLKGVSVMLIIGKEKMDTAGRVKINKLFTKLPREVIPVFDSTEKKIFFLEEVEKWPASARRKVDPKGRVSLPKWMVGEFGEEFFVSEESIQNHSLIPKGFVL